MSGRITGQVRKTLLKFGEKAEHIRCPKMDNSVCKTGYSGFDRTENYEGTEEKLEELR
jgi:hypothetical protein